jgi:hypothetical protein
MLSIGLLLTLVGVAMAVDMPQFTNSTKCVFTADANTISCKFGKANVSCSAVTNFTIFNDVKFSLFGIETLGTGFVHSPIGNYVYNLYPRPFGNGTYVDTKVSLYTGPSFVEYGIRVIESDCFGNLVQMFNGINDFHNVTIGTKTVNLIGEVMILSNEIFKRWTYGYTYGYGYPTYGWTSSSSYGYGSYYDDDCYDK